MELESLNLEIATCLFFFFILPFLCGVKERREDIVISYKLEKWANRDRLSNLFLNKHCIAILYIGRNLYICYKVKVRVIISDISTKFIFDLLGFIGTNFFY